MTKPAKVSDKHDGTTVSAPEASSSRRSASQPNPTTKPTPVAVPRRSFSQPKAAVLSTFPQWLRDAIDHFRSLNFVDPRWLGILDCFMRLEVALDFPDSQVRYVYMSPSLELTHSLLDTLQPPYHQLSTRRGEELDQRWTRLQQGCEVGHSSSGESVRRLVLTVVV